MGPGGARTARFYRTSRSEGPADGTAPAKSSFPVVAGLATFREACTMLGSILWAIIVALLIFWIIGAFFANLGNIVWIALVVAVILIVYNLLTSGRAEV